MFCVDAGEKTAEKKKEKIHIHSQLSNCRCVLSYKCLCSYLCYLYPCMRLWTQTHTCQLIHLPAIQRAALCVFQVSLSSLILLKLKMCCVGFCVGFFCHLDFDLVLTWIFCTWANFSLLIESFSIWRHLVHLKLKPLTFANIITCW